MTTEPSNFGFIKPYETSDGYRGYNSGSDVILYNQLHDKNILIDNISLRALDLTCCGNCRRSGKNRKDADVGFTGIYCLYKDKFSPWNGLCESWILDGLNNSERFINAGEDT